MAQPSPVATLLLLAYCPALEPLRLCLASALQYPRVKRLLTALVRSSQWGCTAVTNDPNHSELPALRDLILRFGGWQQLKRSTLLKAEAWEQAASHHITSMHRIASHRIISHKLNS